MGPEIEGWLFGDGEAIDCVARLAAAGLLAPAGLAAADLSAVEAIENTKPQKT